MVRIDDEYFCVEFQNDFFFQPLLDVFHALPDGDRRRLLHHLAAIGDELDCSEWDGLRTIGGICFWTNYGYAIYLSKGRLSGEPLDKIKGIIAHEFYHAILNHLSRSDDEQCEIEVDQKVKALNLPATGLEGYKKFKIDRSLKMTDIESTQKKIERIEERIGDLKNQLRESESAFTAESQTVTRAMIDGKTADAAIEKQIKIEFKRRGLEVAITTSEDELKNAHKELAGLQHKAGEAEAKELVSEIKSLMASIALALYGVYQTSLKVTELQLRLDRLKSDYSLSIQSPSLDMRGHVRMSIYTMLSLLESYIGDQFKKLGIPASNDGNHWNSQI
jgi:hypothetical protein